MYNFCISARNYNRFVIHREKKRIGCLLLLLLKKQRMKTKSFAGARALFRVDRPTYKPTKSLETCALCVYRFCSFQQFSLIKFNLIWHWKLSCEPRKTETDTETTATTATTAAKKRTRIFLALLLRVSSFHIIIFGGSSSSTHDDCRSSARSTAFIIIIIFFFFFRRSEFVFQVDRRRLSM